MSEKLSWSQQYELSENEGRNPSNNGVFNDIAEARFKRRDLLLGTLGVTLGTSFAGFFSSLPTKSFATAPGVTFTEIKRGVDDKHHIAKGYRAEPFLKWGDPILSKSKAFSPDKLNAEDQETQFGYNCDYIAYFPLPLGSNNSDHGLLCVNHEYTNSELMFPSIALGNEEGFDVEKITAEMAEVEMAAHGVSVVEIKKVNGRWNLIKGDLNRRISTRSTQMHFSGPAAGHDRLKTSYDQSGEKVIGTLNNCGGGQTPWGTYLTAEENFHGYFSGELPAGHQETDNHKRYGVPGKWYAWGKYHNRFDVSKEPTEPNRFGWIVEIDPYDPKSVPVKRTALGRFKHEAATPILNKDGRIVVYMGDDERFEYVYKFVSTNSFQGGSGDNSSLLDDGTLYVASFSDQGKVTWHPLVHGMGPLTAENGFNSQADILIETRKAADLLKATKMDRPEDIEVHPTNGKVYVMLTNNNKRKPEQVDAINRRAENNFGQIIELTAPEQDHGALTADWSLLVQCGDPSDPKVQAIWNKDTSANGWFGSPDNSAFDAKGRLWIATDQGDKWPSTGSADGLYYLANEGADRGTSRLFFRAPVGAEVTGPCFLPNNKSLFVSVQHPGADGIAKYTPVGKHATYEEPGTRWPDFKPTMPTRPSVVLITKEDGGDIGA